MYDEAIANLCRSDEYCTILFWSQRRYVPTEMPMTDTQANHEVANYFNNPRNGASGFLWKCKKGDDPNTCFP